LHLFTYKQSKNNEEKIQVGPHSIIMLGLSQAVKKPCGDTETLKFHLKHMLVTKKLIT